MPTDSQTLQAGRAFVDEAWGRVMQSYASDNTVLSPIYLEGMERFMREPTPGVARALIRMVEALFANPNILYARLLDVSREEACGASLLAWATALDDGSLREVMTKHAADERRHMKIYLAACDLVDPSRKLTRPAAFKVDAEAELGANLATADVKQLLCSMHFAETRNLMALVLYGEILRERDDTYAPALRRLISSVAEDELWHASYTGKLVNTWIDNDSKFRTVFEDCIPLYMSYWMLDIERLAAWFAGGRIVRGPADEAVRRETVAG